jgi:FMN phosphatase YigB (HAD superfamily)
MNWWMAEVYMALNGEVNSQHDGEPVHAIIFDLFDTLVDLYMEKLPRVEYHGFLIPASARALHASLPHRSGIEFETFANALSEVDRAYKVSHYDEGIELPSELRFGTLCERIGMADPSLPGVMAHVHMGLLREQVAMPLNHLGILCALSERFKVGLCSNFSHSVTAQSILEDYGLFPQMHAVVISEELGVRKPRIEIFRAVLEALDVEARHTLFVGDSLTNDIAGAAGAGIRSVWIRRRIRDIEAALESYEGPSPDFQIDDLEELPEILEELGAS